VKQKQLFPTVTVTVAPLATIGWKAGSEAISTISKAKKREEIVIIFVGWPFSPLSHRRIANNPFRYAITEK
jgi:hypothetical protein